ncbi:MAG: hypothetical protein IPJ23_07665 [Ignavibacteriales bacterium]|nr:hypothetical protein [Ignavibacteriales bacterium]
MKKIYHIIIISFLLLLFLSCSPTKEIGKVFTNQEADKLFGTVLYSAQVPLQEIDVLLGKTDKTIMFGIINKGVIILDNKRNLLYPEKAEYKDTDVFTVYSVSLVRGLISEFRQKKMGDEEELSVEQRREVLSVSYGNNTLETGAKCPPLCESE